MWIAWVDQSNFYVLVLHFKRDTICTYFSETPRVHRIVERLLGWLANPDRRFEESSDFLKQQLLADLQSLCSLPDLLPATLVNLQELQEVLTAVSQRALDFEPID